ncbi:MAG: hypothetical protein E7623_05050 [Ruminococcaceae bacterium]|nr:hypothetical protein [Oscillospiraceae bacterium]
MKKSIISLLLLSMMIPFAACGGTASETETETEIKTETETETEIETETEAETEKPEPMTISCVGDSITFGYGLDDPDKDSYPSKLKEKLGDNFTVLNFGVSGATTFRHDEHAYMNMKEYRESLKSQPHIVIIMLGTNDSVYIRNLGLSPKQFESLYERLLKSYIDLESSPKVFVATPPHAYKGRTDVEDYVKMHIQPIIKKIADKYPDVTYINMWDHTENMAKLFPDGIHPNAEGYASIADTMYSYVAEYLGINK